MGEKRKLPTREAVFVASLLYHGFKKTNRRKNLKHAHGYVIPSTRREDADGIDLWVKMQRDRRLFPVQIVQRGTKLYKIHLLKRHRQLIRVNPSCEDELRRQFQSKITEYDRHRQHKINEKRRWCHSAGIAFVLVGDFGGKITTRSIAWRDLRALRYGVKNMGR